MIQGKPIRTWNMALGATLCAALAATVLYGGETFADDATASTSAVTAVPVGAIVAWHKSPRGMPPLPVGWVECNGQTIADRGSPMNGMVAPNLNGTQSVLRGGTSSGTSTTLGAHTHSINPPATTSAQSGEHLHTVDPPSKNSSNNGAGHHHSYHEPSSWNNANTGSSSPTVHDHTVDVGSFSSATAGQHQHDLDISSFNSASSEAFLASYGVVWIMRTR